MSKSNSSNSSATWLVTGVTAVVAIAALVGGFLFINHTKKADAPVSQRETAPTQQQPTDTPPAQTEPTDPKPQDNNTSTTPAQPAPTQEQTPGTSANEGGNSNDTDTEGPIVFQGYSDSGTLSLANRKLENNSFQVERLDWSQANHNLIISGKMRAFEATGYLRVRDENKTVLEPESAIKAQEAAPAWSPFQAQFSLEPEYKGKTLTLELYVKSAKDGSKTDVLKFDIKPQ